MSDVDERRGSAPPASDKAPHAGRLGRARARLNAATVSVDRARERHATVALPFRIVERESRVAASVLAGGLAYKLFLWLLPFGLILGGVFGINNANDIEDAIHGGGLVGAVINTIGDSTRATGFNPWLLLVVGVGGIIWAGRSGARSVQPRLCAHLGRAASSGEGHPGVARLHGLLVRAARHRRIQLVAP